MQDGGIHGILRCRVCRSEVSTELITAEKCKTKTETEFVTADICECECSTQFEMASVYRTIPSEASTPRSLAVDLPSERAPSPSAKTPSVVPSIVSESDVEPPVSPAAIALPPSEFSPTFSSASRDVDVEFLAVTEVTHRNCLYRGSVHYSSIHRFANISRTITENRLTVSSELVVSELPPTETEAVFTDLTPSESDGTPEHETEPERTPSIHLSQWQARPTYPMIRLIFNLCHFLDRFPCTRVVMNHRRRW